MVEKIDVLSFDLEIASSKKYISMANALQKELDQIETKERQRLGTRKDVNEQTKKDTRDTQSWGITSMRWVSKVGKNFEKFAKLTKGTFNSLNNALDPGLGMAQTASEMDIATESLHNWTLAMKRMGIDSKEAVKSLSSLATLSQKWKTYAPPGSNEFIAMQELGLNPQDMVGLGADEMLSTIMARVADLLGTEGVDTGKVLGHLKNLGISRAMGARAEEVPGALGATEQYAITPEEVATQKRLREEMSEAQAQWTKTLNSLLVSYEGPIASFSDSVRMAGIALLDTFGTGSWFHGVMKTLSTKAEQAKRKLLDPTQDIPEKERLSLIGQSMMLPQWYTDANAEFVSILGSLGTGAAMLVEQVDNAVTEVSGTYADLKAGQARFEAGEQQRELDSITADLNAVSRAMEGNGTVQGFDPDEHGSYSRFLEQKKRKLEIQLTVKGDVRSAEAQVDNSTEDMMLEVRTTEAGG